MIKCESLNYDDFVRVFLRDLRVSLVKEVIIEFWKQLRHEICLFYRSSSCFANWDHLPASPKVHVLLDFPRKTDVLVQKDEK